jgi:hypothetical protein
LKVTGNGSWGWGNGELEFYKNENVDIADVPGEPGNKALRIVAKPLLSGLMTLAMAESRH